MQVLRIDVSIAHEVCDKGSHSGNIVTMECLGGAIARIGAVVVNESDA